VCLETGLLTILVCEHLSVYSVSFVTCIIYVCIFCQRQTVFLFLLRFFVSLHYYQRLKVNADLIDMIIFNVAVTDNI